jgi:16S rRNA (cytidine1402-2'-O)-methyltransferase
VRELTKVHEEVLRDRAPLLAEIVAQRDAAPGGIRGECVVVVAPPEESSAAPRDIGALNAAIQNGLDAKESKNSLAKRLAREFHVPKSIVYDSILKVVENKN